MNIRPFNKVKALALVLALSAGGAALAGTYNGTVSGFNTIDNVLFFKNQGTFVNYSVGASGSGSNKLTVKVQQQRSGGSWKTLETIRVDVGTTVLSSYSVDNEFVGVGESLRYRVSRDLGTQAINYTIVD